MEKRPEGDLTRDDKINAIANICETINCEKCPLNLNKRNCSKIRLWSDEYLDEAFTEMAVYLAMHEPQCDIRIHRDTGNQGAKADAGKAEIRLVPMEIVWAIAWIRMYGNRKYGDPENWKTVEPERYRDALMRHLLAYISDPNSVDEESGYPHLWHAACNMAFLMHFDYGEEVLHDPNKTV